MITPNDGGPDVTEALEFANLLDAQVTSDLKGAAAHIRDLATALRATLNMEGEANE